MESRSTRVAASPCIQGRRVHADVGRGATTIVLLCTLSACDGNEPYELQVEWTYAVACSREEPGCTTPVTHDFTGAYIDHERNAEGEDVFCTMGETAPGERSIHISAFPAGASSSAFLLEATVHEGAVAGTTWLSDCRLHLVERGSYDAACGPALPDEAQPCQVEIVLDGSDVRASVLCREIDADPLSRSMGAPEIDVGAPPRAWPATDGPAIRAPAEFVFRGCAGDEAWRPQPPATGVAFADFCQAWGEAYCAPSDGCGCSRTLDACRESETDGCRENFGIPLRASLAEGRMLYDPDAAARLFERLRASSTACGSRLEGLAWRLLDFHRYGDVFEGMVADGEPCTTYSDTPLSVTECAAGFCLGTCTAPATYGDPCDPAAGYGHCFDLDTTITRRFGYYELLCDAGTCTARRPPGAPCDNGRQCESLDCAYDHVTGETACSGGSALPDGSMCSGFGDCEGYCAVDEPMPMCRPLEPDGAPCFADEVCGSGACVLGRCVPAVCVI